MLKNCRFLAPVLMLFSLTLVACQPEKSHKSGQADDIAKPTEGSLVQAVDKIFDENEWYGPDILECDRENAAKAKEIARALDEKAAAIEKQTSSALTSGKVAMVQWGPYQFSNEPHATQKDEWKSWTKSWPKVYSWYLKIKDNPSHDEWVDFNTHVRFLVTDETYRLVTWTNSRLSRTVAPIVESLWTKTSACMTSPLCADVDYDSKEIEIIKGSSFTHRAYNKLIDKSIDLRQRREALISLLNQIEWWQDRVGFTKVPSHIVEGTTLKVPLNLSAFGSDAVKFVQYTEQRWNIDKTHRIEIQPLLKPTPNFFDVFVDNTIGGRANVNFGLFRMKLVNLDTVQTVAHEFGHILGLPDVYYTTFDRKSCEYTYEMNHGDIMSNADQGSVTPDHWAQIKKAYFPTTATTTPAAL